MSDVTQILERIERSDGQAAEKLLPLVYDELRKLAAQKMAQETRCGSHLAWIPREWGVTLRKASHVATKSSA